MTPEVGKWYEIKYGKPGSKRAYHGKAKCLKECAEGVGKQQLKGWFFRRPNQPEGQCIYSYMVFCSRDIKSETTPAPTYEELHQRVAELTNWRS